jgi:hypothetical protein
MRVRVQNRGLPTSSEQSQTPGPGTPDYIDLAATRGCQQVFTQFTLGRTGTDLSDLGGDRPAALAAYSRMAPICSDSVC